VEGDAEEREEDRYISGQDRAFLTGRGCSQRIRYSKGREFLS
jgi:hypothetical protein